MQLPDRAAILAEAKTMYTRLFIGDWLYYYTKERWIGSSNGRYMYFSNGNTALCQAIWMAYREWEEQAARHARIGFASEAAFVDFVTQQLEADAWDCRQEVRTRYGRIDLLAHRDTTCWIIEAKLSMMAPDVTCALGQLLCGHEAYPGAELWFATPAPIQARWDTLFTRYNIAILEGPWTKLME